MNENDSLFNRSDVILENREKIRISGVKDVDSFDESQLCVNTYIGDLVIHGENIKISKLDIENGELLVEGSFDSFFYQESIQLKKSGFAKFFH